MHLKTLTVSQLNLYIKKLLDSDFILKNASIKGEISNLKVHSSGHIYFSLKDEGSKINCIMFKTLAENLTFIPKDGDNVILKGRVSVYQKDGTYQFYCNDMEKEGIGDLFVAYENLKNKLLKEGLFHEKYKKEIPRYSKKIGIITSPSGAAIKDIINVAKRRNPKIEILIYPSLVQGESAPEQLIAGIKYLNSRDDIDVIILARGGGSIEELWAFNDENLAYEIFKCKKPIISGVGHETDFTIADFVCDKRASTPSAASELAVFSLEEFILKINEKRSKLNNQILNNINIKNMDLKMLVQQLKINNPINYIANEYIKIDNIKEKLKNKILNKLNNEKEIIKRMNLLLYAYNPLSVLNKGYAILQNENDRVITNINDIEKTKCLKVTLKSGKAEITINEINTKIE